MPSDAVALATTVGGRVQGQIYAGTSAADQSGVRYQWPGTHFLASFQGKTVYFKVGDGHQDLHIAVDQKVLPALVTARSGVYRVTGLKPGSHVIRLAVVSESQAGPNTFLGFFARDVAQTGRISEPHRQIEFIGDSYTVGYGNTSPSRRCTPEQIWATTDDSLAFGPLTANLYGADYQVNAISGRGVVRNYNGGLKETLVEMYPYLLFDKKQRFEDPHWKPRVIVVGLGTNDFSTELHPGERWATREELHVAYETTYVRFLQELRRLHPEAYLLVWATEGELQAEDAKVVEQFKAAADDRIRLVPVAGLAMSGCDGHPSAADDQVIAGKLRSVIDSLPAVWGEGDGGTISRPQ